MPNVDTTKEQEMPLIRKDDHSLPAWCELGHYEIVELPAGSTHVFPPVGRKQKLIVGQGRVRIAYAGQTLLAEEKANLNLHTADGHFEVLETLEDAILIHLGGHWGEELVGSGLFAGRTSDAPQDRGDPVDYPKSTNFDRHFHDCDEYWIFFQGWAIAVSEGKHYKVGPGDCIATGMGHHHDLPQVFEPIKAAYFETTLEGQQRRGHLWEHTHGPAQPKIDRI
jgi:mannose-6-phosphate isomerase-like protein (cupin superfamily)